MSDNYTSQINEAFEALKYNPHATQQLLQQQKQNPGAAQGPQTLAAAAAANYQKSLQSQPPQQPPQQTVVAGLTQQPQMPMGLEAPNLEDFAQQQQQQRMATGGIVALAHGGPVQGYAGGGLLDDADFSYMDEPFSAQLSNYGVTPFSEGDTSAPQEPKPKPELEAPKKADGSHLSYEDQIGYIQKVLGTPPDVSAEIKGQLEKRMAHEGNVNLIKDIAAGFGGFLGTRGYGQERVGAGIMNALQSSAIHGKEEGDMQDKIDALHLKSITQPYESRHQAATLYLQNQQKLHEAQAAAAARQAEMSYERGTKFGTEQLQGEYGLRKEGLQGKSQMEIAQMKANADLKLEAAKAAMARGELTGTNRTAVYNELQKEVSMGLIDRAELDNLFKRGVATITGGSAPPAPAQQLGNGLSLSGTPTTP